MMNTNVKQKEVQLCKIKGSYLLITMDKRDCDENTIIIDTSYQIESSKTNKDTLLTQFYLSKDGWYGYKNETIFVFVAK